MGVKQTLIFNSTKNPWKHLILSSIFSCVIYDNTLTAF